MIAIEPIENYLQEAAERYVRDIKKLCEKNGVQSKTVIITGHPVAEIVKEAEKSKADLIVMGSHGRSALAAAVLGSVVYGVIHKNKNSNSGSKAVIWGSLFVRRAGWLEDA